VAAIPITSILNTTFKLLTSTVLTVTDDQGIGRSVTLATLSTDTFWRVYLASSASPGTPSTTAASPKSLLAHITNKLNAGGSAIWSVALNSAGFVVFTYTGVTRAGSITWPGSIVENVLGFTSNISVTLPAGGANTQTATYHPQFSAYFISRENDTGWQDDGPLVAIAHPRGAAPYGWSDTSALVTRTFDAKWHPYTWSSRTSAGLSSTDPSGTPVWGDGSRWKTRSRTAGMTNPTGLNDFFAAVALNSSDGTNLCGALLGTYPEVRAGSVTTYDEVYVHAKTLAAKNVQTPAIANNIVFDHWPGITLQHHQTGVAF
jgi:hypothetical protein